MPFASHVLVATDFSDYARAAYGPARDIVAKFRSRLTLLHVRDAEVPVAAAVGSRLESDEEADIEGQRMLLELGKQEFAKTPRAECVVLESGDVADAICAYAREHGVDLIIVGHQGVSGLARLLVGSVAESVMRQASCPVLIVRGQQ